MGYASLLLDSRMCKRQAPVLTKQKVCCVSRCLYSSIQEESAYIGWYIELSEADCCQDCSRPLIDRQKKELLAQRDDVTAAGHTEKEYC